MTVFVRRSLVAGLLIAISAFPAFAAAPPAAPVAAAPNVVVVLNSRDATVSLLDQDTYKEIGAFPVGKEPHHLMPTPDNQALIVAAATGSELLILDPKTGKIQGQVKDIADPYQIG